MQAAMIKKAIFALPETWKACEVGELTQLIPRTRKETQALLFLPCLPPRLLSKLQHTIFADDCLGSEQVASETLKLLNSSLHLAAKAGSAVEASLVDLLAQLLVACAAPKKGGEGHPMLKELVTRLMSVVAAGCSGVAFRAALTSLPAQSRQRLQVCHDQITSLVALLLPPGLSSPDQSSLLTECQVMISMAKAKMRMCRLLCRPNRERSKHPGRTMTGGSPQLP